MSSDKRLINPWDVIDTFFRDTSYYKSQHQIDSFDEFIFSEENGIRNIIKRENPFIIYKGQDPNVNFLSGIFQSFGDAPGGFSEELREFTWALGAEYTYDDAFAFRAGYFNESKDKGARKFLALGAGFKYNVVNIDMSYLFSTAKVQSPLEGTLRFSLTFNIGSETYREF